MQDKVEDKAKFRRESLQFLVSLRLGVDLGASNGTRALERIAAALVGIAGGWGWIYAIKYHCTCGLLSTATTRMSPWTTSTRYGTNRAKSEAYGG